MADDTVQVYGFSIDQKEKPQRCWQLRPQTAIDMRTVAPACNSSSVAVAVADGMPVTHAMLALAA